MRSKSLFQPLLRISFFESRLQTIRPRSIHARSTPFSMLFDSLTYAHPLRILHLSCPPKNLCLYGRLLFLSARVSPPFFPSTTDQQEIVRESQRRRYARVEDVDDVIAMDAKWRDARWELDQLNQDFNKANKEVSKLKVAKENADEAMAKVKAIDERRKQLEEEEKAAEDAVNKILLKIGNLVHDSVPVSDDEANNVVHRTFGLDTKRVEDNLPNHVDLIAMLDIADTERGTDVAGGRGYFLKGAGVLLNQAMINYALTFLASRGHTPLATPFFMRKDRMAECAQLADFDEQLYKVSGEGDDKYLIATSEQTCCSYLRKRWIQTKELPMRFAGYSTCFRKEAGSHGRDTLGIFRVHQFEKVEQFVAVSSDGDESWSEMDRLLQNSEDFYQSLNIPYHVVNIVSGELNDAAAKKYDLEAWFPSSKTFRELVSCSNCTDFQARRLEIRHGAPQKGPEKKKSYCHLLNSTLTATERSLCCVLENWQTPDGLVVPPALRPWMMGIAFVPFVRKLDKKGKLVDVNPPPAPLYGPGAGAKPPSPPKAILRPGGCAASRAIRILCAEAGIKAGPRGRDARDAPLRARARSRGVRLSRLRRRALSLRLTREPTSHSRSPSVPQHSPPPTPQKR